MGKFFRMAGAAGVIAALWAGGAWGQGGGCEYDTVSWTKGIAKANVKSIPKDTTYQLNSNSTPICVFIKGMPNVPDGSNDAFLNISNNSITVNGLPGTQFHYKCGALNNSRKYDGGYYIYIPAGGYLQVKGAILGDPVCSIPQIPAGSMVWNPAKGTTFSGGTGTWSVTGATWTKTTASDQVTWESGSKAIFRGSGAAVTVTGAIPGVNGVSFDTSGYTLSGTGSLTFPAAGASVAVVSGKTATINATLTGGPLTKDSAGTLTLGGDSANTYTGSTTVRAGTLTAAKNGALGSGAVTVAAGATLQLSGGITLANAVSVAGGTSGGLATTAGTTGNGISGAVTFSGTTAVPIAVNSNLTLSGTVGAGSITKSGAGTLILSGTNASYTNAISIAIGGKVTFNNGTGTASGVISGAGGITKMGPGILTLSGANTYTGTTEINEGGITISNASGIGGGAITIVNGANLTFETSATTPPTFNKPVGGATASTGMFVKSGTGALNLTAAINVDTVKVAAGTLNVNAGGALNANITVNSGATLGGKAAAIGKAAGSIAINGGTLMHDSTSNLPINGNLSFIGASTLKLPLTGLKTATASRISVSGTLTISATSKIDITGATDVVDTGTYKIISGNTVTGDFGGGVTVNGKASNYIFSTKLNGKTIELTVAPAGSGAAAIMNYLSVDSAAYDMATNTVTLSISGLNTLRQFIGKTTGAGVESLYALYKPGAAAASVSDTTDNGGRVQIPLTSIPASGNTMEFSFVLPGGKNIVDNLYTMSVATYWLLDNAAPPPPAVSPSLTSVNKAAYLLDPRKSVKNGFTLSVAAPGVISTADGISLTLSVSGQDDPALTPGVSYKPSVDFVGIWYKRNGPQPQLAGNELVKETFDTVMVFTLAALSRGTVPFSTGKLVNAGADTLHFAIAPHWKGAGIKDTIARPLSYIRAVAVDPAKPKPNNPVTVAVVQKDVRTPEVSVTVGASEAFNEQARSVVVDVSLNQSMDNIIDSKPLTLEQVKAGYTYTVSDDGFVGAERLAYYRATVLGADGVNAEGAPGPFSIGRQPPKPVKNFAAEVCGRGSMCLSWSKPTVADNDIAAPGKAMMRIYYSETAISADADTNALTFVEQVKADRSEATVAGLSLGTNYWFAATLLDVVEEAKPEWTLTSLPAICSNNTGSGKVVENILSIDEVVLDNTTSFTATVSLLADKEDGYTYGYIVSLGSDTILTSNGPQEFGRSKNGETFRFTTEPLNDALKFDTTYRIYVYVIDKDHYTSSKKFKEVEIGQFEQQTIVLQAGGSGSVDNGGFKISSAGWGVWNGDENRPLTVTVSSSATPSQIDIASLDFIPVGDYGYKYSTSSQISDYLFGLFKISIKAGGEKIPPPYSPEDVRLYRWNENGRYWEVVFDTKYEGGYFTGTAIDSARSDNDKTYRLMINKLGGKPSITATGGSQTAVEAGDFITATYNVSSNVGNYKIKMLSGPAKGGGELPETELDPKPKIGALRSVTFTIPTAVVNNSVNSGVLAFIIVDDGSATHVENISYQVKSKTYGGFPVDPVAKKWLPFGAQVELEDKSVKTALSKLFYHESDTFAVYDTLYHLYRWYETSENRRDPYKWVKYNGNNDSTFEMKPTNLMWFKTSLSSRMSELDFGEATSMPLRSAFDITLPAGQWTDLVLPFRFNVCLGDVLEATAEANGESSLEIYKWIEPDKKQKYSYVTKALVLATADSSAELVGEEEPFAVYNSGNSAVILRIPPTPAFMSRYYRGTAARKPAQSLAKAASATRGADDGAWHYTLRASTDDAELSDVIVGYSPTERAFAVPPSFGSESVVLVGDDGAEIGHHFGPSIANGRTYKLRFYNDGRQRATFTFSAKPSAGVPANARITFVRASTGEALGGGSGDSERSITVSGMSHEDVLMIVGNSVYRAKAAATNAGTKFAVGMISVNKSARSARISYYVPESGINLVEVSIYDIKGRQVWRNTQGVKAAAWNTAVWNGRGSGRGGASTGLYVVRVKAMGANGRAVGVDTKRIMFSR